jgi:hypothetical protein
VPVYIHFWVHPETFEEREPAVHAILAQYPEDVQLTWLSMPPIYRDETPQDAPAYSWLPWSNPHKNKNLPLDACIALPEWDRLDDVIAAFPDPNYPGLTSRFTAADGRYRLGSWFFCYFERHWMFRGMTNALMDYYLYPEKVHQLYRALTDFYLVTIERAAIEGSCDGFFTSDDLGTQTGEFFSPDIFREFFKPYYKELIDKAHEHNMHFWLHTCGNVNQFIPEWIDIGLDVIHPIQKHAMQEQEIARKYGDKITIFSGIEVQQVIPWGTPDEVRAEVRHLIDTFWRNGEGRCMFTAGNGINGDCTLASLEALFDEAYTYGSIVAK